MIVLAASAALVLLAAPAVVVGVRTSAVVRAVEEPERSAGVLQVVLPVAAVVLGWVVAVAVRRWIDTSAVALLLAALVAGFVALVLVDALPRAAALAAPERTDRALTWPYRVLAVVAGPAVTVSGWVAGAVLLPVGMWLDAGRGRGHTADELAELVGDEGRSDRGPDLLAGALGFPDARVEEVMARREQLVTVPRTSTVARAEDLVHRSGHSRVLVVGDSGEVTGFLHAKDLLAVPKEQRAGFLPAGLVRVALRVEPQDHLRDVLLRMRRARRHVAVVEEGTELVGLVTLEDVLEAIVGDIRDETDVDPGPEGPEGERT